MTTVLFVLEGPHLSMIVFVKQYQTRKTFNEGDATVNVLYVSMCNGNLDDRRLGNQLFNFAALLYATQGLNKNNSR